MTRVLRWRPPLLTVPRDEVSITFRQADVLAGICHGLTDAQIGRRLFIVEQTVKTHVKRLLKNMGARDRCHAAALAMSGQITVTVTDRRTQ